MKDQIVKLSNKMIRVYRKINGYDQNMVGIVRYTRDDDFDFYLNNENNPRVLRYENIKYVRDLTI